MALAARRHLPADRKSARCRRVGDRVRHRLRRTGPHVAADAAAAAGAERPLRRGDGQAAGERSGPRRETGRDDAHGAGRHRVHPERPGKRTRPRREGRVRLYRRRSSQPCRALFAARSRTLPLFEAAAVGNGFLNQHLDWDNVVRRVPLRLARSATNRTRRWSPKCFGSRPRPRSYVGRGAGAQSETSFRREYRDDRSAHRSADRADRCRRPGCRAFRAAAAGSVRLGARHTGRHVRPVADRPEHRPGRDVGDRGDQRSPGDAARPECSGGRSPRAADRADSAGRLSCSARIGRSGRKLCSRC